MGKKGEATKQKILDAAAVIFWKNNYHGVNVDRICEAAEINKASFYQYFPSKEEIALAALKRNYEITIDCIYESSFSESNDPIERLHLIFKKIYNIHKVEKAKSGHSPGCPFVNAGMELALENENMRDAVDAALKGFYSYWEQIYEDLKQSKLTKVDIPKKIMGKRIHSILNGAMVSSRVHNHPKDIIDIMPLVKFTLGIEEN